MGYSDGSEYGCIMSNLKQQGTKAFIWDFFGRMATHGVGFVVSIFLARLLEPSDFGLIAMIMVIIGMASVFTDVGLGTALIQRRRVRPIHYSSVFYFNIAVGVCLTLLAYFSAPWISNFYHNTELTSLTQIMSLSFIINAFSSVQSTKLRKELNYARLTKIGVISSFISGSIGVSLAFLGTGVWSLVAQSLSQGILYTIIIWSAATWKPSLNFSWKALGQLWSFGFRMFISNMITIIFERLDFLIIGKLFTSVTLGYFQRAKSLNNMAIQYSLGGLISVLFPVLSRVQNDLRRFQNIIIKAIGIISFIAFLLLGGLYVVSEELIVLLFSDKWLPSAEIFKILIVSGFGYPLSALLVNVLSSRGKSKEFLRLEIQKKVVAAINLIGLYFFGINIYLYGLIVQAIIGLGLNILYVSREIRLPFAIFLRPIVVQMSIAVCAVILTLSMVSCLEAVNIVMFMFKWVLFMAIYIGISYGLKTKSFLYVVEQIVMGRIRK